MVALYGLLPVVGFVVGWVLATHRPKPDVSDPRIDVIRQSVMVMGRVMEDAGVAFNRDYDGNITGLRIQAEAHLTATGGVSNG